MYQEAYEEILLSKMLAFLEEEISLKFKLDQNNNLKHTVKPVKLYLSKKNTYHSALLSDLNPMENLWRVIDNQINRANQTQFNNIIYSAKINNCYKK